MAILNIHFETSSNNEKFPLGPMILPKPRSTFEIEVAAAEMDVVKSKPLKDKKAVMIKKIMYINK